MYATILPSGTDIQLSPFTPPPSSFSSCLYSTYISSRGGINTLLIHIENPKDATVYQNFISYLYEAQHVSGDTLPIIRSLKLH